MVFVQWEAASINPHLMRRRKAEAETGEFAAVRKAVRFTSEERWRTGEEKGPGVDGRRDGQVDRRVKRDESTAAFWSFRAQTHRTKSIKKKIGKLPVIVLHL